MKQDVFERTMLRESNRFIPIQYLNPSAGGVNISFWVVLVHDCRLGVWTDGSCDCDPSKPVACWAVLLLQVPIRCVDSVPIGIA